MISYVYSRALDFLWQLFAGPRIVQERGKAARGSQKRQRMRVQLAAGPPMPPAGCATTAQCTSNPALYMFHNLRLAQKETRKWGV